MGFRLFGAALFALLAGCASSTMPGTMGIGRPQLMMVPSATVNAAAAGQYLQMSTAATGAGKLNADPALAQRVKDISARLIREVGVYRPEAATWRWEVNVFERDELNAFCYPGGKIGVYSGLVRRLDLSDDELAAVLGHEIAHALREHAREKASQSQLSQSIVQAIANSSTRNARAKARLADVGSLLMVRLPYSRQMESEADLMGLELMARAGYEPRAASTVWRKMQAQGGGASSEFFNTHPSDERRLGDVEAAAPKVLALYQQATSGDAAPTASVSPAAGALPPLRSASARAASRIAATSASPSPAGQAKPIAIGTHDFQVFALARERACPVPQVSLLEKGPGYESYALTCGMEPTVGVMCQFGNCRVE